MKGVLNRLTLSHAVSHRLTPSHTVSRRLAPSHAVSRRLALFLTDIAPTCAPLLASEDGTAVPSSEAGSLGVSVPAARGSAARPSPARCSTSPRGTVCPTCGSGRGRCAASQSRACEAARALGGTPRGGASTCLGGGAPRGRRASSWRRDPPQVPIRLCPCSGLMPHMELDDAGTCCPHRQKQLGLARWSVFVAQPTVPPLGESGNFYSEGCV
eukprot:COSAG06_NODE_2080_length_7639_cov_8.311671_5_plen_213_part_00